MGTENNNNTKPFEIKTENETQTKTNNTMISNTNDNNNDNNNNYNINNTNNNSNKDKDPAFNINQQEEIGKDFAFRKIELATLALRSSQTASQSPLFPKHDIHKYYLQPFIASSISMPTLATVNVRSDSFSSSSTSIDTTATTNSTSSLLNSFTGLDKNYSLLDHSSSSLFEKKNTNGFDSNNNDNNNNGYHQGNGNSGGGILLDRTCSLVMPSSEPNKKKQKPKRHVKFKEEPDYFIFSKLDEWDENENENENGNDLQFNNVQMNSMHNTTENSYTTSVQDNQNHNTYRGVIENDIDDLYIDERDSVSTTVSDENSLPFSRNQSIFNLQSATHSMDGRSSSLSTLIDHSTYAVSTTSSIDQPRGDIGSVSNNTTTLSSNDSAFSGSDSYLTAASETNLPSTISIIPTTKTLNTNTTLLNSNNINNNNNNNHDNNNNNGNTINNNSHITNLQSPLYNSIPLSKHSSSFTQHITDSLLTTPPSSSPSSFSMSSPSLPAPSTLSQPFSSSSTSLPLSSTSYANLMAFQRKGEKISKNAILEILENGSSTNKLSHRKSRSSLYAMGQTQSVNDVEQEIKKAIEMAKLSNKIPSASSSTSSFIQQQQQMGIKLNSHQIELELENKSSIPQPNNNIDNNNNSSDDRVYPDNSTMSTSLSLQPLILSSNHHHLQNKNTENSMDEDSICITDVQDKDQLAESIENMNVSDTMDEGVKKEVVIEIEKKGVEEDEISIISPENSDDVQINDDFTLQDPNINTNNNNGNKQYLLQINTNDLDQQRNFNMENGLPMISISSDQSTHDFGETLLDELGRITLPSSPLPLQDSPSSSTPKPVPEISQLVETKSSNGNDTDIDSMKDLQSASPSTISNHNGLQSSSTICQTFDEIQEKHLNMKLNENKDADSNQVVNGRLYVKVIAAENLDLPIDYDAPSIQCILNDSLNCLSSNQHKLEHTVLFNHDFVLDNIPSDNEFTLTLQANLNEGYGGGSTKKWNKRTSMTSRTDDLLRYINKEDGAIAQTRVSISDIFSQCRGRLCTASFALVNGWYRPAKKSTHQLLLSKSKKEKRNSVHEKAIGKITLELFYLPNIDSKTLDLPLNIEGCEQALNIQRFHKTIWHSGYMSQLGGDVKYWRRRYFKLIGGQLYSYSDTIHAPRTMIDLSKAIVLATDKRVLLETNQQKQQQLYSTNKEEDEEDHLLLINNNHEKINSQSKLILYGNKYQSEIKINNDDDSMDSTSITTTLTNNNNNSSNGKDINDDDDLSFYPVKNGFQLKFDTGDKIEFFCDSANDRERWLEILKVILGRIPPLPNCWL
ncbi:unnamed protein product [Cunninghamella echinulata]